MIKVNKDLSQIPNILTSSPIRGESRITVFQNNIDSSEYIDDKNSYKVTSIQNKLNEIYHLKCAYCEQKLLDSPKHIEHYRPKSIYYWLAYSWDNLLLSCGNCNSAKGNRFETLNSRVTYRNEQFNNIHNLGSAYDTVEKPLIINPENDDMINEIIYDRNGKVSSLNNRVQHTIENACNLNRDELVQLRQIVLTDFINDFNKHFNIFIKEGSLSRFEPTIEGSLSRFEPTIETFIEKCNETEEFYSLRYFILKHVEVFFEELPKQKILRYFLTLFTK